MFTLWQITLRPNVLYFEVKNRIVWLRHCVAIVTNVSIREKHFRILQLGTSYSTTGISELKMENISEVTIEPMGKSNFVNPLRMKFKQNGKPRTWDLITLHESVCIVIFNTERKKLVFVRQFRPAVFYNSMPRDGLSVNEVVSTSTAEHSGAEGLTLELCAGIVDKTTDLVVTAQSEVLEECGYQVPLKKFERIISCRAGVGVTGERQTIFYAEVDDSMKVSEGGGSDEEGEMIETVEMSIDEVKEMLKRPHVNSPGGFLFGVTWFLANKALQFTH